MHQKVRQLCIWNHHERNYQRIAFLCVPHTSFPVEEKGNPRDGRLKLDAARPVAKKNLTGLRLSRTSRSVG